MKINLLSSKIYNRIAAGEVVERPASVVKELVENSIDAGATEILIDIENGGISSIRITDNGCGIEKSELKKALLPHATSKIATLKDLDAISSLGFRGEALPSIASVSKLEIASKPKNQQDGAKITSNGGDMTDVVDCGVSDGTVITVNNLFYNTPVREKFLKTERSEENEITSVVARFILGNPTISFKYTADGKVIYSSFGDGLESAMINVYGLNIIENCYFIDTEKNGVKINGYIGKHNFVKGNRSYQTTFINNRYVVNQTVSSAIMNAYSSYLMKRQYPFFVLNLNLPTEIVDVNVHPNKLDVRFSNNQIIYSALYSVISKVLDGSREALSIVKDKNENHLKNKEEIASDYVTHKPYLSSVHPKIEKTYERLMFNDSASSLTADFSKVKNEKPAVDIFEENKKFLEELEKKKKLAEDNANNVQTEFVTNRELKYIGQALNTYLIFDDGIDLFLADQHAAHERILFDKFTSSIKNSKISIQPLLIPFVLNVNNEEFEFLSGKIAILNSLGIEISEFGRNAFKVSGLPSMLLEMNLGKFFSDILNDFNALKSITLTDIMSEKIAQKACKAAIKSGDRLTEFEVKVLIDKLKENIGLKCPHGRPVVVKISRQEIDKWFKRIL